MNSDLYNLDFQDFVRGIITAVFAGIGLATIGIVTSVGFDVFTADWQTIGRMAVNGAFGGFVGYLVKRFFSDSEGQTFGAYGL